MALGRGVVRDPRRAARLPPLNPLRAFEAAAHHGSFTLAAAELHVTQGAVSQSVKALEQHLGDQLFIRAAGGLRLTSSGSAYARSVSESFQSIAQATLAFRSAQRQAVVTIRAYTSFLTYWLLPRIPAFEALHPGIEVRFIAANDRLRLEREPTDLRIRYGDGRWRGMEAAMLVPDELTPVMSPALLPPAGAPYLPCALAPFTWLHASQRPSDWQDWLTQAGDPGVSPAAEKVVEELSVVYRLAIAGAGVALGNLAYVQEELASGRLFRPVDAVLRRRGGYYLVWSSLAPLSGSAQVFQSWLMREAKPALSIQALPQ